MKSICGSGHSGIRFPTINTKWKISDEFYSFFNCVLVYVGIVGSCLLLDKGTDQDALFDRFRWDFIDSFIRGPCHIGNPENSQHVIFVSDAPHWSRRFLVGCRRCNAGMVVEAICWIRIAEKKALAETIPDRGFREVFGRLFDQQGSTRP